MKKIITYVSVFVLLMVGIVFLGYSLINWDGLRASIERKAIEYTGHELKITGGVELDFFPKLTLKARGINLENVRDDLAANIISISELSLRYSYFDLLLGRNIIDEAVLIEPQINIEKYLGEEANWNVGADVESQREKIEYEGVFNKVTILSGSVNIITGTREEPLKYNVILDKGALQADSLYGPYQLTGVSYGDIGQPPIEYDVKVGDLSNDNSAPLDAYITVGKDRFEAKGSIKNWSSDPTIQASITFKKYLQAFLGDINAAEQIITLKSQLSYKNRYLELSQMDFSAPGVELTGSFGLDVFKGETGAKSGAIAIKAENADFDKLFRERQEGLIQEEQITPYSIFKTVYPFVDNVDFTYDILVSDFIYNKKSVDLFLVKSELRDGITLHKMNLEGLPGSSQFILSARVDAAKNSTTGSIQIEGENAWEIMSWLGWDASFLNSNVFNDFEIKSSYVKTANQVYFRRVDIEGAGLSAVGQLNYSFYDDGRRVAKSALRIPSLNFNELMAKRERVTETQEGFDTILFDNIRNIDAVLSQFIFSLHLDQTTIGSKRYEDASLVFDITPGVLEMRDVSMKSSREGIVRANMRLNTSNLDPIIDISLATQKLYHQDVIELLPITVPDKPKLARSENISDRWSYNEIYLDYLGIYMGSFNMRADEYYYKDAKVQNLVLRAKLGISQIEITEAKGSMFGSTFELNGNITTRPMYMNLFFSTPNMNLRPLMKTLFGFTNIDGYSGLSASLSMSGNSQREWVESMSGTVNILARNITVRGFDIVLLQRKIPNLKDVRAVRYWGHKALHSGLTQFKYFSGVFTIERGIMSLHNAKFPHEMLSSVKLNASFDLPDWEIRVNSPMTVSLGRQGSIGIALDIEGSIDQPQIFWDRKGIERYWAERFYR